MKSLHLVEDNLHGRLIWILECRPCIHMHEKKKIKREKEIASNKIPNYGSVFTVNIVSHYFLTTRMWSFTVYRCNLIYCTSLPLHLPLSILDNVGNYKNYHHCAVESRTLSIRIVTDQKLSASLKVECSSQKQPIRIHSAEGRPGEGYWLVAMHYDT